MFCGAVSWAATLYIHFRGLLTLMEFRHVQNSLSLKSCVLLHWQRYCTALVVMANMTILPRRIVLPSGAGFARWHASCRSWCILVSTCTNKSSAVAEMGDRLATIDMGRKLAGHVPFEGAEPHLTQCCLGLGLPESYLSTKWHLDPSSRLVTIDMGRKLGVSAAFKGSLVPHVTQYCLG